MAILKEERIGNQRLILGDCDSILPSLGTFDALVSDPPYDFDTSGGGIFRSNRTCMDDIAAANIASGFNFSQFTSAQFKSIIFFCHNDQLVELLPYLAEQFSRHALCSWHKTNAMPVANKHYQPDTEFWIHAWNKGFEPQGKLSDKKRFFVGKGGQDTSIKHPTVKPLDLMMKVITNVAGGRILDPYMGSGTTLVAAQRLGRQATGIEINSDFFEIACKRVSAAACQPDFFVSTDPENKPQQQKIDFDGGHHA